MSQKGSARINSVKQALLMVTSTKETLSRRTTARHGTVLLPPPLRLTPHPPEIPQQNQAFVRGSDAQLLLSLGL